MTSREHIRCFIALPLAAPTPAPKLIEQLQAFSPLVKPVDPTALHLTMRFLGPASEARIAAFQQALSRAVDAVDVGPLTVTWRRPTFFPGQAPKRARTIVLSPADDAGRDALHRLEGAVSDALEQLEPPIEREARGFHPHLTLARLKKPKGKGRVPFEALESTLARYADTSFDPTRLDRLVLFQSTLTPQGPHYTRLHERLL